MFPSLSSHDLKIFLIYIYIVSSVRRLFCTVGIKFSKILEFVNMFLWTEKGFSEVIYTIDTIGSLSSYKRLHKVYNKRKRTFQSSC